MTFGMAYTQRIPRQGRVADRADPFANRLQGNTGSALAPCAATRFRLQLKRRHIDDIRMLGKKTHQRRDFRQISIMHRGVKHHHQR